MATPKSQHRVYRSINVPLTVCGAERRLFFLAMLLGAVTFQLTGNPLGMLGMFLVLYLLALWATKKDPQMLKIVLNSSKFKSRYDPLKRRRKKAG
jgi:type IV secretory pathway TrbD component